LMREEKFKLTFPWARKSHCWRFFSSINFC
jgi:hypothetical protein